MKSYKILVLTDHRKHGYANSLYILTQGLRLDQRCSRLSIASRGHKENNTFFEDRGADQLWVFEWSVDFTYSEEGTAFTVPLRESNLQDYDVIMMRLPRPLTDEFLHNIADRARNQVIINHPLGMIKTSNKKYLINFPELCPPIQLCSSISDILSFSKERVTILKPLREYGGKGLIKIDGGILVYDELEYNTADFLEKHNDYIIRNGYLAMAFLKNVSQGDKRIVVVNGCIIGASLRMPPLDRWICNVAQGGSAVPSIVTKEEEEIVRVLQPALQQEGILMYGVDTLVNDEGLRTLSEVNTLSVGGLKDIAEMEDGLLIEQAIKQIYKFIEVKYGSINR